MNTLNTQLIAKIEEIFPIELQALVKNYFLAGLRLDKYKEKYRTAYFTAEAVNRRPSQTQSPEEWALQEAARAVQRADQELVEIQKAMAPIEWSDLQKGFFTDNGMGLEIIEESHPNP